MNCDQVSKQFSDYLVGDLDEKLTSNVEQHLASCAKCQAEYGLLKQTWEKLDELPEFEPSEALQHRFQNMLAAFQAGHQVVLKQGWLQNLNGLLGRLWFKQPAVQIGFAVSMLILGVFLGTRRQSPEAESSRELGVLREGVQNLSNLVTLSLLRQPSSSERLRGVSYGAMVERPDEETLTALLNTLNYDQTPNVRLAAIDALAGFYDRDVVRLGLIESLAKQTSPLIQIALVNLFVELEETQSLQTLGFLQGNEMFNPTVRRRAGWAIEQLQ